ncbi:unnamed protein product [Cuscuta epithymum]|uniref:MIF4G domain-containing protein n=1 Tax=Cuscuta epithymum TaxID=186058 RepID=A0AAV0EWN7_9ASTE|nr:unnamed protein product [Cuscuta epithymum]
MVVPKNSMDLLQEYDSEPDHGIHRHEKDHMFSKISVERKPRIKGAKLGSDGDINAAGELQNSPMATKSHTSGKIGMKEQSSDENVVDANSLSASCNDSNKTYEVVRTKESANRKRKKSRLEELLDSENGAIPADEDLALEKKLKVKKGKLKGDDDDGFNMLFDDMPSVLELIEGEKLKTAEKGDSKTPDKMLHIKSKSVKSIKQKQVIEGEHKQDQRSIKPTDKASSPPPTSGIGADPGKLSAQSAIGVNAAYIAPHRRSRMGSESQENAQIRRQVQGLLNRLSQSNVESITSEMSTIIHTVGRSLGSLIISEKVLTSCSGGPRGNEQHAAVFAAFVAGMSCSIGIDFGAKILASLAKHFEEEYQKEDNMSLRNLTILFSYLYIFGVFSSDLIYDFLVMLSKRLTEADFATILAVLQYCGMKLRADDPIAMKNFITSIQNRVNELKILSEDTQSSLKSKRMDFMVQTICEIKNIKKRTKEETVQLTHIRKWLQKLRVDDILLRGLKWCKLIDPDKKGQWWLSGDVNVNSDQKNVQDVAQSIDMEVLEAKKMLQLAAEQGMNTEGRRAIFLCNNERRGLH